MSISFVCLSVIQGSDSLPILASSNHSALVMLKSQCPNWICANKTVLVIMIQATSLRGFPTSLNAMQATGPKPVLGKSQAQATGNWTERNWSKSVLDQLQPVAIGFLKD
ncbi:hypothetical protein L210DRAFT_3502496 [Boletus edulis BED1]|uniref:Uncharacterized protein n=1 Tax=Boletus edulis BED1 TaxID=1328754 RepID=A0AAD4GI08_BOLED|nr:hypothetical protein L210DRAFT_3502496 [Boletus edulis BED1]